MGDKFTTCTTTLEAAEYAVLQKLLRKLKKAQPRGVSIASVLRDGLMVLAKQHEVIK